MRNPENDAAGGEQPRSPDDFRNGSPAEREMAVGPAQMVGVRNLGPAPRGTTNIVRAIAANARAEGACRSTKHGAVPSMLRAVRGPAEPGGGRDAARQRR